MGNAVNDRFPNDSFRYLPFLASDEAATYGLKRVVRGERVKSRCEFFEDRPAAQAYPRNGVTARDVPANVIPQPAV